MARAGVIVEVTQRARSLLSRILAVLIGVIDIIPVKINNWLWPAANAMWAIVALIYSMAVLFGCLIVFSIAMSLAENAHHSQLSLPEYVSYVWRYSTLEKISANEVSVAASVSQPILLGSNLLILILPVILVVRKAIARRDAIIITKSGGRKSNRKKNALELARQFRTADEICIISGDYSWFKQDGDEGGCALNALIERLRDNSDHIKLISYKNIDQIRNGLKSLDQDMIDLFVSNIKLAPYLNRIKITIITRQGYRTLYMISAANDGEAEQRVIIKDKDYGRKLIDSFHSLCP